MSWIGFLAGIVLGALLTVGALAFFLYDVFSKAKPVTAPAGGSSSKLTSDSSDLPHRTNSSLHSDWPPAVIRFLRNTLDTEPVEESVKWLNVIFIRFFLELRKSDLWKERIRKKLLGQMQKKIAQTGFVKTISITELHLGDFPPRLQRAQLVRDTSLNEDLPVQVDFDIVYQGGVTITIEVELAAGLFVPVTVTITGLAGKLRMRLPRPENATEFNLSFVSDPDLQLQIQSRFVRNDNEYTLFQNQLNSFLAKKLKAVFVEQWVLPTWRFFDLPLVSMPTFVHPNCKCNLDAPIKPMGDLSGSVAVPPLAPLFATTTTAIKEAAPDMADSLVQRVLKVVQDTSANDWVVVKNKSGVIVQKEKRRLNGQNDALIMKGTVAIRCDPKRVFNILSSPELNGKIESDYLGCTVLEEYGDGQSLRHFGFRKRDYVVFEVVRKLPTAALDTWVIAQRTSQMSPTIQPAYDPSKSQRGTVLLYGYHVEAITGDHNVCTIVCMTQLSANLSKLNVSWQRLYAIKQLIEKLLAKTSIPIMPAQAKRQNTDSITYITPTTTDDRASIMEPARSLSSSSSHTTTDTGSSSDQPLLSLDDVNGLNSEDINEDASNDEDNNDDDEETHIEDDGATTYGEDDQDDQLPRVAAPSIRPAGTQAPVPLSSYPKISSDNYKEIVAETLAYFLVYARRENDPLYIKPWRPVKASPGVTVQRKVADESTPADVVRGTVLLACPPTAVFAALKGSRYRNMANPDLVTCDILTAYEDGVAVRHYRYKGSLLPDRDCVVIEIAQQVSATEWLVIQRSVFGDEVAPRDAALRFQVHVAGYYISSASTSASASASLTAGDHESTSSTTLTSSSASSIPTNPEPSSCSLTHISQISADYASLVLTWLRTGWARNLSRVKYALERSSESVASAILPRESTIGYTDAVVRSGGIMWLALHHNLSDLNEPESSSSSEGGGAVPSGRKRRGQLMWEFSTRSHDIRFGVVFAPSLHDTPAPSGRNRVDSSIQRGDQVILSSKEVADRIPPWEGKGRSVLPSSRFNSHVCPSSGSVNVSAFNSGTYYLVWDNRFARFTDKHVTYKAAVTYTSAPLVDELAELDLPPAAAAENDPMVTSILRANSTPDLLADNSSLPSSAAQLTPPPSSPVEIPKRRLSTTLIHGYFSNGANLSPTPQPGLVSSPVLVPRPLSRTLSHNRNMAPPLDQAISGDVVISRKEAMRVPLDLMFAVDDVRLVWEFRSGKDDLEFSIFLEEHDQHHRPVLNNGEVRKTTILPTTRLTPSTDQEAVSGELHVSGKPGRYMFVWDNNFSRWKSKMLSFSVAMRHHQPQSL